LRNRAINYPITRLPNYQIQLLRTREEIVCCERCPRLREYCARIAQEKRRAYRDEVYWGRPVPGFGDPRARLLIVGLAPAAHGANRTGRMFTGDSSGDFLYRALHRAGFASQAHAMSRDDGLVLRDLRITAAVRCAPPDNAPTTEEKRECLPYLVREIALLPALRVIVCLGHIALDATLRALAESEVAIPTPRPRFAHGAFTRLPGGLRLACSYHPSRQNTNTGRLTQAMLDRVFLRAAREAK
jgi:uracil-DNA glycosylase